MRAISHIALCLDEIQSELASLGSTAPVDGERSRLADLVAAARSCVQQMAERGSAIEAVALEARREPPQAWAIVAVRAVHSQLQAREAAKGAATSSAMRAAVALPLEPPRSTETTARPRPGSPARVIDFRRASRVAACAALVAVLAGVMLNSGWVQARMIDISSRTLIHAIAAR